MVWRERYTVTISRIGTSHAVLRRMGIARDSMFIHTYTICFGGSDPARSLLTNNPEKTYVESGKKTKRGASR